MDVLSGSCGTENTVEGAILSGAIYHEASPDMRMWKADGTSKHMHCGDAA